MKNTKNKKNSSISYLFFFLLLFSAFVYLFFNQNLILTIGIISVGIVFFSLLYAYISNYKVNKQKKDYKNSLIGQIDAMTGIEFEEYLAVQFKRRGFRVKHIGQTGDYGVDLVLTDKRGKRIAVQAKRYKGNVGVHAVQEVIAGAVYHNCSKTMVVTNAYFTNNAKELAQKANVVLWDRTKIKQEFSIRKK